MKKREKPGFTHQPILARFLQLIPEFRFRTDLGKSLVLQVPRSHDGSGHSNCFICTEGIYSGVVLHFAQYVAVANDYSRETPMQPGNRDVGDVRHADLRGLIYHRAMQTEQFFDDEFKTAIQLAGAQARIETLQAGIPVFYRDNARNLDIVEYPGGRKFEIHFLDGAPGDTNYKLMRELKETAA